MSLVGHFSTKPISAEKKRKKVIYKWINYQIDVNDNTFQTQNSLTNTI